MKSKKSVLILSVIVGVMFTLLLPVTAQAAQSQNVSVTVGSKKTMKLKNSKRITKVKIKNTNGKVVKATSTQKKGKTKVLTLQGKKAGVASLTIISYKKKKVVSRQQLKVNVKIRTIHLYLTEGESIDLNLAKWELKKAKGKLPYTATTKKITRVKMTSSNKKVATTKYKVGVKGSTSWGSRWVNIDGVGIGSATVNIKAYHNKKLVKNLTYNVKISGPDVKKAFDIQNRERVKAGVPKLEWDENLYEMAQLRAKEITKDFDHHPCSPAFNFTPKIVYGENILYDCCAMAKERKKRSQEQRFMDNWIRSEGHYSNIIEPDLKIGAMAYVVDIDKGRFYWVSIFTWKTHEEVIASNQTAKIKFQSQK